MSDPVTMFLISAGMSLAQGGATAIGQAQQARTQERLNDIQTENIRRAEQDNLTRLRTRAQQEAAAASDQIIQNNRDARSALSTARVAAGDAGVRGLSVDALMRDLMFQRQGYNDSVRVNLDGTMDALSAEGDQVRRRAASERANLPPVERPNYLGIALETGANVFGSYRDQLYIDPRGV